MTTLFGRAGSGGTWETWQPAKRASTAAATAGNPAARRRGGRQVSDMVALKTSILILSALIFQSGKRLQDGLLFGRLGQGVPRPEDDAASRRPEGLLEGGLELRRRQIVLDVGLRDLDAGQDRGALRPGRDIGHDIVDPGRRPTDHVMI